VPPEVSYLVAGSRYIVESPEDYLMPFLNQITAAGLDCGGGYIADIPFVPIENTFTKGEGCWQIIEDILAFGGKMARFNREKELIVSDIGSTSWSNMPTSKADDNTLIYNQDDIDNPPLPETDIGDFETGIQLSYSKEGVYSKAIVSGFLGKKDGETEEYEVNGKNPVEVPVTSAAGMNILNGQEVELKIQVDERYKLETEEALENFGQKELFKTIMGAKSATYNSESIPLAVEVGMVINGSSKLGGATSIYITALNRTTDAQENKITTGISGTRVPSEADSTENNLGWV